MDLIIIKAFIRTGVHLIWQLLERFLECSLMLEDFMLDKHFGFIFNDIFLEILIIIILLRNFRLHHTNQLSTVNTQSTFAVRQKAKLNVDCKSVSKKCVLLQFIIPFISLELSWLISMLQLWSIPKRFVRWETYSVSNIQMLNLCCVWAIVILLCQTSCQIKDNFFREWLHFKRTQLFCRKGIKT